MTARPSRALFTEGRFCSNPDEPGFLAGAAAGGQAPFAKRAPGENQPSARQAGPRPYPGRGRWSTEGGERDPGVGGDDMLAPTLRASLIASPPPPQGRDGPQNDRNEPHGNFHGQSARGILFRHPHEATVDTVLHTGLPPRDQRKRECFLAVSSFPIRMNVTPRPLPSCCSGSKVANF